MLLRGGWARDRFVVFHDFVQLAVCMLPGAYKLTLFANGGVFASCRSWRAPQTLRLVPQFTESIPPCLTVCRLKVWHGYNFTWLQHVVHTVCRQDGYTLGTTTVLDWDSSWDELLRLTSPLNLPFACIVPVERLPPCKHDS